MTESGLLRDLQQSMPVKMKTLAIKLDRRPSLIIVDEVNGFAKVGAGPLAPHAPNAQVDQMVSETDRVAKLFTQRQWPVLVFMDTHVPGKPEHPYPPHCEAGTGQEELVDDLRWLEADPNVLLVKKDCINGFIGAMADDGRNRLVDWVNHHKITDVIVVGICTDICVMDFVLTTLSARNHGLMPSLQDVHVYEPGCATYDLSPEDAQKEGLPPTAAHPQMEAHHMGLYFMASRGAKIIDTIDIL